MSEKKPTMLEATLLAWRMKYPAGTGHLDADMIAYGEMLLAEQKRRDDTQRIREICLSSGGHFFRLPDGTTGEWTIDSLGTLFSAWRSPGVKCEHCDAWLTVKYEEDEK